MFRFPVHWVLVLVENVWGPAETKKQVRNNNKLISHTNTIQIYIKFYYIRFVSLLFVVENSERYL